MVSLKCLFCTRHDIFNNDKDSFKTLWKQIQTVTFLGTLWFEKS